MKQVEQWRCICWGSKEEVSLLEGGRLQKKQGCNKEDSSRSESCPEH